MTSMPLSGCEAGLFQGGALMAAMTLVMLWPRPPAPRDELLAGAGFCALGAGVGARLVWAIAAALRGERLWWDALTAGVWEGGFSSFGALGGALFVMAMIHHRWRASRAQLADFFVPIGLGSLALARLGCVAHGCDFGAIMPDGWESFGMHYHDAHAPAWQWFSSQGGLLADGGTPALAPMSLWLSGATILGVIVWSARALASHRAWQHGLLAARLITTYGVIRAVGELWRHPGAGAHLGEVNVNLVLALAMTMAGLVMWRLVQTTRRDALGPGSVDTNGPSRTKTG